MKASRRNLANEVARREKLAQGKPKLSKYEEKRRRQLTLEDVEFAATYDFRNTSAGQ